MFFETIIPNKVLAIDGSAAAPSITFASDPTLGFYKSAANEISVAVGGARVFTFTTSGQFYGAGAGQVYMPPAGSVGLTAGGSNQNITLTPSGTGATRFGGTTTALLYSDSGLNLGIGTASTGLGLFMNSGSTNVLFGTTTDSGNGRLQLASHTTSAGGIGFGTDTYFCRVGVGQLQIGSSSIAGLRVDGAASGSNNGAAIMAMNGGSTLIAIGNYSAIYGGAYNASPVLYAANTILCNMGFRCFNATDGIGYGAGAGGTVTQATSKSTAVTLHKCCGLITMHNAALAAGTVVTFGFNCNAIAATDQLLVQHESGGTLGAYLVNGRATGTTTAAIDVRNVTGGSLSEAIVLRYTVIKGVSA